jgi:DNA-binding CsgD family transcriptional regulator
MRLIRADKAGYYEFTERRPHLNRNTFYATISDGIPEIDWSAPEVAATVGSWPLLDARVKNTSQPLRLRDFLSAAELRRNPWYQEVQRPRGYGEGDEMKGWIRSPAGVTRAFYFVRTMQPAFADRDRAMLSLLLAHLSSIRERWERRHHPEILTAREREVLAMTAAGLTNAEIATKLFLSRSTVRTHLEHIFDKLGVHSRTAAVAWLQTRT